MEIILENIAKRYLYDWIFKKIHFHFKAPTRYAILGANGSGKSTLLKIISGHLSPTKGQLTYLWKGQPVDTDVLYKKISFAAPYIDLIEEFTLQEAIAFHQQFKPFRAGLRNTDFLSLLQLEQAAHKEVRFFSSGMKQRLKLGLAICADTPILLLDEPTSNLDQKSIDWYQQLLNQFADNRLIIIASNEQRDIEDCEEQVDIWSYK